MSQRRYKLIIIASHRLKDEFMHAADLFEPFKRLIESPLEFIITLKKGDRLNSALMRVRHQFKGSAEYRLIALIVVNHRAVYVDPDCRVISTGHGWALLKEVIEQLRGELH